MTVAATAAALVLTGGLTAPATADEGTPTTGPGPILDVGFADGVATDAASGLTPSAYGDPVFGTDAWHGGIVSLDGVDDAIGFPTSALWEQIDDAFTVECVFRIDQGMDFTGERTLCSSKESGGIGLFVRDGQLWGLGHIGGGYAEVSHPISGERWYHGAVVWDGATITLYINGAATSSKAAPGTLQKPAATARHFVIGADSTGSGGAHLFSPPASFASARLYPDALTAAEVQAAAAAWAIDDCDDTSELPEGVVLDEKFCGDALPEGFTRHSGTWSVADSVLRGTGVRHSASRITFGQSLEDFRLDVRARFESTTDSGSWLALVLDIPADGDEPWQHAGFRPNTTAANSTEFARRNANATYTVTNQYARTPAIPTGAWFDASIVVRGTAGEWWVNGKLIGTTTALTRSTDGIQGLIIDGATISFDRITVTELEKIVIPPPPPQCLPLGDGIRQPGQAGYAVGHRGAMTGQPENTIPAFQYAWDNGAPWIEFDILWTSDEEIVVLHDDTVDRTMTGSGAIRNMTLAEFKALDIKGYPGLKAPTFEEALAWMKETGAKASIEYKGAFPLHLAQKTADLIKEYGVEDQSAALSFTLSTIENMRTVMPELPRHINLSSTPADPVAFAAQYGASSLTWTSATPPASVVAALHAAGVKLNSGTTDNPAVWEAAAALGVDAITVNDPAAYATWLAGYNERHNFIECGLVQVAPDLTGGAVTAQPSGPVLPGESIQLDATPAPGHEFVGWEVTPSDVEVSEEGTFTMPEEGDVTVGAQFGTVEYAITYALGAGGTGTNPDTYTVKSDEITLAAPTRDGHEFIGWAGSGFEGIRADVVIPSGSTGDLHFTAVWEAVPVASPSPEEPEPSPSPAPTTPGAFPGDLYSTPGFHQSGDRWWLTTCEPYSQTVRCTTEIWSTQVSQVNGRFVATTGWNFNNLTYLPFMTRAQWAGNPLGQSGTWTASDGRKWRTECDTEATGQGGCRSYTMSDYVAATQADDGTWSYRWTSGWVFNNMVRFRA